jgi:hypothetical protein
MIYNVGKGYRVKPLIYYVEMISLPTKQTTPCQERGIHNLRGFSIETLLYWRLTGWRRFGWIFRNMNYTDILWLISSS